MAWWPGRGPWRATRGEITLEIKPATPVAKAARTGLTDEAERLVRFIARDASRHEVRWTAP